MKKNWKNRFFVATNEYDNFTLYYFANEKDVDLTVYEKKEETPETKGEEEITEPSFDVSKAKGKIYLSGYRVKKVKKEEKKKQYGEFSLRLKPWPKRRRHYYLRFETAEERDAWEDVLEVCCLFHFGHLEAGL